MVAGALDARPLAGGLQPGGHPDAGGLARPLPLRRRQRHRRHHRRVPHAPRRPAGRRFTPARRDAGRARRLVLPAAARLVCDQVLVTRTLRMVDAPLPPRPAARASRARQRPHLHGAGRSRHFRRLVLQPAVARARLHAAARRRHHPQRDDGHLVHAVMGQRSTTLGGRTGTRAARERAGLQPYDG